jgi:two-component system nitrate/nitrite response regulator NarL
MEKNEHIRIIIADDHRMFLDGLAALLAGVENFNVVGEAGNGVEVLTLLETVETDLVIADISMPEMDGMELAKQLKTNHPEVKVLALSMHNESSIISSMMKNGISGYVLKDVGKEELLQAVNTIYNGETWFSEEVKSTMMESLMKGRPADNTPSHFKPKLSERETEILQLIAQGKTQNEIAETLFISHHTVIFHRRKLLRKFDAANIAELVKEAGKRGCLDS